ncbi:hypothetical protein COLO4_14934 [Corchorus olitorius]|uniref:F-box domain-containing protein n=1 Tax=Corchorus olitorius TaxID=93759 RepID=A0A1R3JQF6_9ROSI|nr:hypothetical protein COLO4_14934 [Corchorus olitorius]
MINDHKKIEEIKESNINRDFSNLPDEILCQIISYLPFKVAVETSLLSTPWKHLWKNYLEENGKTIEDVIAAISKFVHDFNEIHRPRKVFGLKFNYANNGGVMLATVATSSTHDRTLLLDFSGIQPKYFSSKFFLVRLKSIHLISVPVKSFKVLESKCLESLRISKCNRLETLDIKNVELLKSLTILDCPKFESLDIEGSKSLSRFRYRGTLNIPKFRKGCYFGELNDAMLCFRQGPGSKHDTDYINRHMPIIYVKSLVSLTLCRWVSEIDPKSYSMGSTCQFKESEKRYCLRGKQYYSEPVRLVVKLEGFAEERDVMALAWRLKKLLSVEPFIIVKSHWSDCLQFIGKVSDKQRKNGKVQYELKEGVRDVEKICPNHVHMNL